MHLPGTASLVLAAIALWVVAPSIAAKEHEFRFKKPEAQSVAVLGEFNGWQAQPMTKGSDGTWTAKVSLPTGTHGYKFLVNGTEWTFDHVNPARKTVDGVENSAVEVTEANSISVASPTATPVARTPLSITTPLSPSLTRAKTLSVPTTGTAEPPAAWAVSVMPGEVITQQVPLSAAQQAQAAKEGNPPVTSAKVSIGVPSEFDPARTWPILVISATVNASNIELLGAYKQAALEAGWVVMAADGSEKPKEDRNDWRLAMIGAGLDYMAQQWPASKSWPIAAGGFSGGAKRSGFIAAALAKDGRKVIGMLMGGCNQDVASVGLQEYRPPSSAFKQVPIFLSSGTTDTIATPQHHENVMRSMTGSGFRKVRLESFPGAHDVYPQHTTEALKWFAAQAAAAPGASPAATAAFDRFFKKP